MTEFPPLDAATIMAAGYKRIKAIQDRHGINSPEVLAACERWGGILDDINYPDSTCRWCGHAVTHAWENDSSGVWYHVDSHSKHCRSVAAAVATPWEPGDSEPVERAEAPADIPVKPRPARKVIKK